MKEQLFNFFLWFRANGELYVDKSIEHMIDVYLNEKFTLMDERSVASSETHQGDGIITCSCGITYLSTWSGKRCPECGAGL